MRFQKATLLNPFRRPPLSSAFSGVSARTIGENASKKCACSHETDALVGWGVNFQNFWNFHMYWKPVAIFCAPWNIFSAPSRPLWILTIKQILSSVGKHLMHSRVTRLHDAIRTSTEPHVSDHAFRISGYCHQSLNPERDTLKIRSTCEMLSRFSLKWCVSWLSQLRFFLCEAK